MNTHFDEVCEYDSQSPGEKAKGYEDRMLSDELTTRKKMKDLGKTISALYQALAQGPYKMWLDYQKEEKATQTEINSRLNLQLKTLGIKSQGDATFINRVVKFNLAGGETYKTLPEKAKAVLRRQFSSYSSVLGLADQKNVGVDALAEWIKDNGGIQEISSNGVFTEEEQKQKREGKKNRDSQIKAQGLTVTQTTLQSLKADLELWGLNYTHCTKLGEEKQLLVVATLDIQGNLHFHAVVDNERALRAAHVALTDEAPPKQVPQNLLNDFIEK